MTDAVQTGDGRRTRLWSDVDLACKARQIGHLFLEHSVTRSAYGQVRIPIACINVGDGPTVLVAAGNHGDEYEGPVALLRLLRRLEGRLRRGRLILLPALNAPAVAAGTRISPLDGVNLNRCFPGDPAGSPTQQIAHYVGSVLIPMSDLVIDLHSGGASLHYLPIAQAALSGDEAVDKTMLRALEAFAAPHALIFEADANNGTLTGAARGKGVAAIAAELGGSAAIDPDGILAAEEGVLRVLAEFGLVDREDAPPAEASQRLEMRSRDLYVHTWSDGIFEPAVRLGETVATGQTFGLLHSLDDLSAPPKLVRFAASGILVCRRPLANVRAGDCLGHLATLSHPVGGDGSG